MNSAPAAPLPRSATAIPWRVAPPLIGTALIMLGAGFLGTLLLLGFRSTGLREGFGATVTARREQQAIQQPDDAGRERQHDQQ